MRGLLVLYCFIVRIKMNEKLIFKKNDIIEIVLC